MNKITLKEYLHYYHHDFIKAKDLVKQYCLQNFYLGIRKDLIDLIEKYINLELFLIENSEYKFLFDYQQFKSSIILQHQIEIENTMHHHIQIKKGVKIIELFIEKISYLEEEVN